MAAKLQLTDVTVRYGSGAGALTAVDGVSLTVPSGGTVGLVGESGCGKSTIARAVVALVPVASGTITLDGVDHTDVRKRRTREFRRRVQMVFQDPYASLNPRITIGGMLVEILAHIRKLRRAECRKEALRLLDLVGLPASALDRYPHQFSGGQRQRAAIARALAVEPELVIYDEVTSALDVSVQGAILNLLRQLQSELRLSYVFISHDLATVRYMSDTVSVMYLGRVVENVATDELFDHPEHPYTRALMASLPRLGGRRRPVPLKGDLPDPRKPPSGCRFHTRCPVGPKFNPERTVCIERDPQKSAAGKSHNAACHFADAAEDAPGEHVASMPAPAPLGRRKGT
ncbi:MAG TPA: ABC transporter ATP-binding protein [Actinophytocola sp.]|jgi:oligopeptide/dipeptide ABC transporter ATP-binding protein|nr:ABC transporter ATP-binding protein [Actinophytocola sp.]